MIVMKIKIILLPILLCCNFILAQTPQWKIIAPQKDSIIPNENLFISVSLSNYSLDNNSLILLDNKTITGNVKISGGNLSFLTFGTLADGRHQISVRTFIKPLNRIEELKWVFYVNVKKELSPISSTLKNTVNNNQQTEGWIIQGNLSADSKIGRAHV